MINLTDAELIKRAVQGDDAALTELVQHYLKPAYAFAYRYVRNRQDAEDITQEVFVKVWKNLKKFDAGKPFQPWLYQITKNTCFDWLRKKSAVPFSELDKIKEIAADASPPPDVLADQSLLQDELTAAAERLAPKYAKVISLYHQQNLNFRQIAELLQEPLNTVKSRYRRALLLMKKMLKLN